ncbi:hypothetical protein ACKVV1_003406 [Pyricularia oryzae]
MTQQSKGSGLCHWLYSHSNNHSTASSTIHWVRPTFVSDSHPNTPISLTAKEFSPSGRRSLWPHQRSQTAARARRARRRFCRRARPSRNTYFSIRAPLTRLSRPAAEGPGKRRV